MSQQTGGRKTASTTVTATRTKSFPEAVAELQASRKMSELIVALETLRKLEREAHDACEVAAEALRQKCRDAGTWPKGWDKLPEARRWRKLAMEAAADHADAADAVNALINRAQRVLDDLNRGKNGRDRFNAAE